MSPHALEVLQTQEFQSRRLIRTGGATALRIDALYVVAQELQPDFVTDINDAAKIVQMVTWIYKKYDDYLSNQVK